MNETMQTSHVWIDVAGYRRIECKTCGTVTMIPLKYLLTCELGNLCKDACQCGGSVIDCVPERGDEVQMHTRIALKSAKGETAVLEKG